MSKVSENANIVSGAETTGSGVRWYGGKAGEASDSAIFPAGNDDGLVGFA
jgi:hypothetical protein